MTRQGVHLAPAMHNRLQYCPQLRGQRRARSRRCGSTGAALRQYLISPRLPFVSGISVASAIPDAAHPAIPPRPRVKPKQTWSAAFAISQGGAHRVAGMSVHDRGTAAPARASDPPGSVSPPDMLAGPPELGTAVGSGRELGRAAAIASRVGPAALPRGRQAAPRRGSPIGSRRCFASEALASAVKERTWPPTLVIVMLTPSTWRSAPPGRTVAGSRMRR
jgi:hypothetical protein